MVIEFEYFLDATTADITLSVLQGVLTEIQENALKADIYNQQSNLLEKETGSFIPRVTIKGLPKDIVFSYCRKPASARSLRFNMYWEGELALSLPELPHRFKQENVNENSPEKINQEMKSPEWVNLFIDSLTALINSLPMESFDNIEKMSLDCTITELKDFLTCKTNDDSVLLLFGAYLHFSATYYWEIDRNKAGIFLLAAHTIESQQNKSQEIIDCVHTPQTITKEAQLSNDTWDKNKKVFTKLFYMLFDQKCKNNDG